MNEEIEKTLIQLGFFSGNLPYCRSLLEELWIKAQIAAAKDFNDRLNKVINLPSYDNIIQTGDPSIDVV